MKKISVFEESSSYKILLRHSRSDEMAKKITSQAPVPLFEFWKFFLFGKGHILGLWTTGPE